MAKYVFSYNANNDNYDSQTIREGVIKFLNANQATSIQQCLDTTFIFDSNQSTEYWWRKINIDLDTNDGVLERAFCMLNKVFFTRENGYEIQRKCNHDLQDFIDETILNQ